MQAHHTAILSYRRRLAGSFEFASDFASSFTGTPSLSLFERVEAVAASTVPS
jgi:hypothetical protein